MFARNERGGVAIIFALTATIIFGLVGGAVDYGRWLSARSKTLSAMDAAVLAAGRALQLSGTSKAEAIQIAKQYYNRNKSNLLDTDSVTFSIPDDSTTVVATSASTVKTPFLSILGVPDLPVNNVSKAVLAVGGNAGSHVEIAMMLDVTGSMCGGWSSSCTTGDKLDDMKAAAKDLIDIVVWKDQSEFKSRVALVPFSEYVNVSDTYFKDVTNKKAKGNGNSRTCVSERDNANRYNDKVPNKANGYFGYYNDNKTCKPQATIMALSSDKTELKAHIDGFGGQGSTAGHLGTAWAWYTLSPKWSSIWGADKTGMAYSLINDVNEQGKPKLYKIAVLMTDGEFNEEHSGDDSATQAKKLCTNMKNDGIIVYTVGFAIGNWGSAYNTLKDCATSSEHFYNASNGEQLKMAFRDIALKISTLRLAE